MMRLKYVMLLVIMVIICYQFDGLYVEASSDDKIESVDDFDNKNITIGVVDGFIFEDLAKKHHLSAKLRHFSDRESAYRALRNDEIDGVIDDDAVIRSIMRSTDVFYMTDGYLEKSDYSFIFTPNDRGTGLSEKFNEYINSLKSDGVLEELDEKWFGDRTDNKKSDDLPLVADESSTNENSSKIIRLAVSDDGSIPFCYMSAGKPVGYDIDIIIGFCNKYGYKISLVETDFADMQSGVADGRYDLGCGGITVTEKRKKDFVFCEPVYSGGVSICVHREEGINRTLQNNETTINRVTRHIRKTFVEGKRYLIFVRGICVTLIVSLVAVLLGLPFGFLLYRGTKRGPLIIKGMCRTLLWLVQGVPAIMIIMSLYYAFYRNMYIGSILASITGFIFAFAEMCYRNIDRNAKRVDEGKFAEEYRLEFFDDIHFIKGLFKAAGNDVVEDFRDHVVIIVKASSVIGYVAAQDMVKAFDVIRVQSLETVTPLIATTLVYMVIIKIITATIRVKKKG